MSSEFGTHFADSEISMGVLLRLQYFRDAGKRQTIWVKNKNKEHMWRIFYFVVKIGRKITTECLIPGGGSGFQAGSSSSSSGATRPARIVEAAGGSPEPRVHHLRLGNGAFLNKILQIFGGLVLGCIKTKFCKKIRVWQHFSRSTRFAYFCTAAVLKL